MNKVRYPEKTIYEENDQYICKKCKQSANSTCKRIWHEEDCKRWPQEITDICGNVKGRWFLSNGGNTMAYTFD